MFFIYYIVIFLAIMAMMWELLIVVKRNKTVKIRGNDDYFVFMVVLGFSMFLLSPSKEAVLASAISSICVLVVLLFQLAIKRGISTTGFQKLFYCIPFERIKEIKIEQASLSKLKVYVLTEQLTSSLFFNNSKLKSLIKEMQDHNIRVYLDEKINISL